MGQILGIREELSSPGLDSMEGTGINRGGKPDNLGNGVISPVLHARTLGHPRGQGAAGTSVQLQVPLGFSAAVFGPESPSF